MIRKYLKLYLSSVFLLLCNSSIASNQKLFNKEDFVSYKICNPTDKQVDDQVLPAAKERVIEIKYLKDCPQHTAICAEWSFTTWGHHTPERTLADFVASRQEYLNDDKLPLTLVAFYNQVPVGMCSLAVNRGILPELTPWLATLYVAPEYHLQGIGTALEQAICNKAKALGFNKIYCFTSDQTIVPWYKKAAWQVMCTSEIHNHTVTVLEKFI